MLKICIILDFPGKTTAQIYGNFLAKYYQVDLFKTGSEIKKDSYCFCLIDPDEKQREFVKSIGNDVRVYSKNAFPWNATAPEIEAAAKEFAELTLELDMRAFEPAEKS